MIIDPRERRPSSEAWDPSWEDPPPARGTVQAHQEALVLLVLAAGVFALAWGLPSLLVPLGGQ